MNNGVNTLRIGHWNARGLQSVDGPYLEEAVKWDILIITETWLCSDAVIPSLLQAHFQCFTAHRPLAEGRRGRHGGGLLLGVNKAAALEVALLKKTQSPESIWISLLAALPNPVNGGHTSLTIGGIYLPPNNSSTWGDTHPMAWMHEQLLDPTLPNAPILLVGDLNARVGQVSDIPNPPTAPPLPPRLALDPTHDTRGRELLQLCHAAGLTLLNGRVRGDIPSKQTYLQPTTGATSAIDVFLLSTPLAQTMLSHPLTSLEVRAEPLYLTTSDHYPVMLTLPRARPTPRGRAHRRRKARRNQRGHAPMQWIWDASKREAYVNAVTAGSTVDSLQTLVNAGASPDTLLDHLIAAVNTAARVAGLRQRRLCRPARKKPMDVAATPAPRSRATQEALTELRAARTRTRLVRREIAPPPPSLAAALKHEWTSAKKYKRHASRDKRTHIRALQAQLRDRLRHNPRLFWRTAAGPTATRCGLTPQVLLAHFRALRTPNEAATPQHIHAPPPPTPSGLNPSAPPFHPEDMSLSTPFTQEEIWKAVQRLCAGKAADIDGLTAELFKCQGLVAPLTLVANCIFTTDFPARANLGLIVPIYKGRNNADDPNNYRGVTLIHTFAKLYATLLNTRLTEFRLGAPHRRARGQGGFLPDHGTVDHIFTLNHLIKKYTRPNSPLRQRRLYTVFVDLSKAFDLVDRDLLWNRLAHLGIRGRMLLALQSYYHNPLECVKGEWDLSPPFCSNVGVKQGCPLSPTLFGLFIDELEEFLDNRTSPDHGLAIGNLRTLILLYADDIVFLGKCETELQTTLDIFSEFCHIRQLTVNLTKTQAVTFCGGRVTQPPPSALTFRGVALLSVEQYKYLGVWFHWKYGAKNGGQYMLESARRALFRLRQRIRALLVHDPAICIRMFNTLVSPILLYASEVWGVDGTLRKQADSLFLNFIKDTLGLARSTETTCLLVELSLTPPSHQMLIKEAAFWDRLATADDDRILGQVAFETFTHLKRGPLHNPTSWGNSLLRRTQEVGVTICRDALLRDPRDVGLLNNDQLTHGLANTISSRLHEIDAQDHRDLYRHNTYRRTPGERLRTYASYVWNTGRQAQPSIIPLQRTLTAFRLGSHGLQVRHRGNQPRIERSSMECPLCRLNVIEDEYHFILECPVYTATRQNFRHLFQAVDLAPPSLPLCINIDGDQTLRHVFDTPYQEDLARFIRTCLRDRKRCLHSPRA